MQTRWWALVPALALVGCTAMTVRHDYDPDVDFRRFETFAWMPRSDTAPEGHESLSGPFLEKRIRKSLVEGLSAAGLTYVTRDADLLVAFQLRTERRADLTVGAYGPGYIYPAYPQAVEVRRYRQGTLVVDLVDAQTGDLVWRGWSVSDLHPRQDPRDDEAEIARAVHKILERYPPYGRTEGER